MKCTWLLPSFVKDVPYAKMQDINSVSARKLKMGLDKRKLRPKQRGAGNILQQEEERTNSRSSHGN